MSKRRLWVVEWRQPAGVVWSVDSTVWDERSIEGVRASCERRRGLSPDDVRVVPYVPEEES